MYYDKAIVEKVAETLVCAGSTFPREKKDAYEKAIRTETNEIGKWCMETILQNAVVAENKLSPLCDDTGIPHVVLEIGKSRAITGTMLESIKEGIRQGLRKLPGRPMSVKGDALHRIDQSLGMDEDPGALDVAPILIRYTDEDVIRVYVLMFGGGPAIRAKTYRVFHKHSVETIVDEIVKWATEGTTLLGCTPCTLGVGVGRSHYEAASLMLQAFADGSYEKQTKVEQEITERINDVGVGPLGLGGKTTVLATFMKVGPQRASGVRVVSMRPSCCFEPRIASVIL